MYTCVLFDCNDVSFARRSRRDVFVCVNECMKAINSKGYPIICEERRHNNTPGTRELQHKGHSRTYMYECFATTQSLTIPQPANGDEQSADNVRYSGVPNIPAPYSIYTRLSSGAYLTCILLHVHGRNKSRGISISGVSEWLRQIEQTRDASFVKNRSQMYIRVHTYNIKITLAAFDILCWHSS